MYQKKINCFILILFLYLTLYQDIGFCKTILEYNIEDFGARGDNITINTIQIQKAIDECSKMGGGIVIFPQGTFITGTIILKSGVYLHLYPGNVLKGSPRLVDYPNIETKVLNRIEHTVGATKKQLIYAEDETDIGILGNGTFYPNGEAFQDYLDESPNRPYGLRFVNCSNVTVKDIYMKNSAYWMQRYINCKHLRISGLRVWNHCNLNNDGLDIDGCKDVIVSDCIIDSSDDAICIKSEGYSTCQDVLVNNCIASSFASALKLGTGSCGGFQRISFTNCVVKPSSSLTMIHTTGSRGGMSGIEILEVDGANATQISFSNITIDSSDCPIFIKLGERNSKIHPKDYSTKLSTLQFLNLNHINVYNAGAIPSSITGYVGNKVNKVNLNNINIYSRGEGSERDTSLQIPENSKSYPVSGMFASSLPASAFYIRHVENIELSNLYYSEKKVDARPLIVLEDVTGAYFSNIINKGKNSTFKIKNSKEINIEDVDIESIELSDKLSKVFCKQVQKKYQPNTIKEKLKPMPIKLDSGLIFNFNFENNTSIQTTNGKIGKGAIFNNANFLKLGQKEEYNVEGELSISFWLKLDRPDKDRYYRIIAKRKTWNDPAGYELEINPLQKRFNFSGANKGVKDQGLVELIYDDEWHFYTATIYDSRLRVYRDGTLVGWDDWVSMPSYSSADLVIGANSNGGDNLEGILDEIRVWKRALNIAEIQALYKLNSH